MIRTALKRKSRIRRVGRKRASVASLDALWSRVVRQRAGWKCEHCGSERTLQGAHIYPKGAYPALRHDPKNGACLCWSCHLGPKGAHKHPMEWGGPAGHFAAILFQRDELLTDLALRALTASRPDREGIKLALEMELRP